MLISRFLAYLIDLVVLGILSSITNSLLIDFSDGVIDKLMFCIRIFIVYLYFMLTEKIFQRTFGKYCFGLKTVTEHPLGILSWSQASLRAMLKAIMGFLIGFVYLFSKDKSNTWYERITRTRVIKVKGDDSLDLGYLEPMSGFGASLHNSFKNQFLLFTISLLTLFLFSMILVGFVGEVRYLATESMSPTIKMDDRLLFRNIYNFNKDYKRGDIVMFYAPINSSGQIVPGELSTQTIIHRHLSKWIPFVKVPELYVKRIIGLPDEEIEIRAKEGVFINEQPLIGDFASFYQDAFKPMAKLKIPQNSYFLLGDNIDHSLDSRHYGPVSLDRFCGLLKIFITQNGQFTFSTVVPN
jgi:signal peptidase I